MWYILVLYDVVMHFVVMCTGVMPCVRSVVVCCVALCCEFYDVVSLGVVYSSVVQVGLI